MGSLPSRVTGLLPAWKRPGWGNLSVHGALLVSFGKGDFGLSDPKAAWVSAYPVCICTDLGCVTCAGMGSGDGQGSRRLLKVGVDICQLITHPENYPLAESQQVLSTIRESWLGLRLAAYGIFKNSSSCSAKICGSSSPPGVALLGLVMPREAAFCFYSCLHVSDDFCSFLF